MTDTTSVLAAVAATLALWLGLRLARASRARSTARAGFFNALDPHFDRIDRQLQPTGFPRLTGHRRGLAFDLQALPDSLTYRKLPALWVLLSLPEALPITATLDILARPSGQEPFSRFASLPLSLPPPPYLPEGTGIRTDNAAVLPPEALIERYADLFRDPRTKELVLSPKGLRIVLLAEEADRTRYLLFRDAEMGIVPLDPARIVPLLDTIAALRQDLLDWAREPA